MEFIIFVTIIVIALFALLISSIIDDAGYKLRSEVEAEKKKTVNATKNNAFKRLGLVEGIIYGNGKFYKTFNSGNIEIRDESGSITLGFDITLDGCYFGDIRINGISIKTGMPKFSDYEREASYVIGLFETAVRTGVLSANLVEQAKKLIDEYQEFAILLDAKVIVQPRGSANYVWVG